MKNILLYPLVKSAIDNGWDVFNNGERIGIGEKYELSFLSKSGETYVSLGGISITTSNNNKTYIGYKDFLFSNRFLLAAVGPYCGKEGIDLEDYIYELSDLIQRELESGEINEVIMNINSLFILRQ